MPTTELPDGRQIVASRDGPTDPWTVYVAGAEQRVARGRWLLALVSDLLGLPCGKSPDWVLEAVDQLSGRDTLVGRRFPCPCCDFLTLEEAPTGTFQICPVCRWEDDNVQYADLDYEGGANKPSLREARENFRRYGQKDRRDRSESGTPRSPLPEEHP